MIPPKAERSWFEPAALTDPLTGYLPTWRLERDGAETLYLEVVRDLGVPGLDEASAPSGDVVVGELVTEVHDADVHEAPPTVPLTLVPTAVIPVAAVGTTTTKARKTAAPRKPRAPRTARRAS